MHSLLRFLFGSAATDQLRADSLDLQKQVIDLQLQTLDFEARILQNPHKLACSSKSERAAKAAVELQGINNTKIALLQRREKIMKELELYK